MPPSTAARARSPTSTTHTGAGALATRVPPAWRSCAPTCGSRRSSTAFTSRRSPPSERSWRRARRFCLVTDAVEAAGMPPGSYRLGDRDVHVEDGAVRLADGTLAGSVLTMDAAVRNLVASGAALSDAVHAASTAPARLLGRDDLGAAAAGSGGEHRGPERRARGRADRRGWQRGVRRSLGGVQAVRVTFAKPGGRSGSTPRRRASASASC